MLAIDSETERIARITARQLLRNYRQDREAMEADLVQSAYIRIFEKMPGSDRIRWEIVNAQRQCLNRWLYGVDHFCTGGSDRFPRRLRFRIADYDLSRLRAGDEQNPVERQVMAREAWRKLFELKVRWRLQPGGHARKQIAFDAIIDAGKGKVSNVDKTVGARALWQARKEAKAIVAKCLK